MKRLTVILFISSIIAANIFASEPSRPNRESDNSRSNSILKNEGYISIGTVSCVGLFGGMFFSIADAIGDSINEDDSSDDEPFGAFSLGLGYNLFLFEHLGLGGFLNFERFGDLSLVSAQLKLTGQYGFRHFKFYHAASGGVLFIDDGTFCPIFDVTLLGLKLDFDDFNIFVEGCLPSTAFLKIGFSYYF